MADRSAVPQSIRYQSTPYRAMVQDLKIARSDGTTLVTISGASRTLARSTAQELASTLGRSLLTVDLSQVTSKYIGETEKNLRTLFARAEAANAILFFDEADALFGKRSEVKDGHDRYSNIEMAPITQLLATFGGVIVAPLTHSPPHITTRSRLRHVRVKFPPD